MAQESMCYAILYETKAQISLYTLTVGDSITNFNSSCENKFSFEPGHGHVIGRLHRCIGLVVFPILCILKMFQY